MSAGPEPSSEVRALAEAEGRVRVITRRHVLEVEGQVGVGSTASSPSALDSLLGALAADLVIGFRRHAARAGIDVREVELSLAARLDNPLVALGVVGETGGAGIAEVRGSLYVGCDADEPALRTPWNAALAEAPVYSTLMRCAPIHIDIKPVP